MNSKFLIIYTAFNAEEYIEKSLTPFLKHPDCYVVASSRKFSFFPQERNDDTVEILHLLQKQYPHKLIDIDCSDEPVDKEHEAKNTALKLFAKKNKNNLLGIDFIWIVDSDEFYNIEDIDKIIEYVENARTKFAVWFTIPLKNYIFDGKTFLQKPFEPPRIFRTNINLNWTSPSGHFYLHSFFWDNDVAYARKEDLQKEGKLPLFSYDSLAHSNIPKDLVWISHYCWLSNERSKSKVEYQEKHFGQCSFKWENNQLKFNTDYFNKIKEDLPMIKKED